MNTEVENYIKDKLSLNDTPQNNLKTISNMIEEFTKTRDKLEKVRDEMEVECFKKWYDDIKKKFRRFNLIDQSDAERYAKVGFLLKCKGSVLCLFIEKDGRNVYFGIGKHYADKDKHEYLQDFLSPVLTGFKKTNWWFGVKYSNYDDVYKSYLDLVSRLFQHAKIDPEFPKPLPKRFDD